MIKIPLDKIQIINTNWRWFDNPSKDNLLVDIKRVCYNINLYIINLSQQKERVLVLNYGIKTFIDYLQNGSYNYEHHLILDSVKHFIRISDKSIGKFNLEN